MAQIPKNAVAKYRGCTRKSVLGFGVAADLPVGDILKVDPDYIAWVYYNIEKVTFSQDILDELQITEKINKPGTDKKAFYRWKDAKYAHLTEEEKEHGSFARYRNQRNVALARLSRAKRETTFSKAALQANNHGHIKLNH